MDLRKELIDFTEYIVKYDDWFQRYKNYPSLIVTEYLKSINCDLDETQAVRQNEDAESNFNCLGVMKGLSDNECSSHCGSEHCDGY